MADWQVLLSLLALLAGTGLAMALLNTGSALGNTISLQNIVMVKSVVQTDTSEGYIVRVNLVVVGVYLLLVSVMLFWYLM